MTHSTVYKEISRYLGSDPKPYFIPSFANERRKSICMVWDLPDQKDEDKPLHIRYMEILQRASELIRENPKNPQIEVLSKNAAELLRGLPITKRSGIPLVSMDDLLARDKTKGIRKEWWELHSRFKDSGVCIFQGYQHAEARATRVADILLAMPGWDPFEFIRINQTRGNNRPRETDQIISALRKLDHEYGILVIFALLDFVEFIFERPVPPESRARIQQRLHRLCPSAEGLGESIRSGRVALWWD